MSLKNLDLIFEYQDSFHRKTPLKNMVIKVKMEQLKLRQRKELPNLVLKFYSVGRILMIFQLLWVKAVCLLQIG
jgi:hypothetical protein